eukprot:SAG11_NODE_917_length_6553_cov_24.570654_6_plen_173_part_00
MQPCSSDPTCRISDPLPATYEGHKLLSKILMFKSWDLATVLILGHVERYKEALQRAKSKASRVHDQKWELLGLTIADQESRLRPLILSNTAAAMAQLGDITTLPSESRHLIIDLQASITDAIANEFNIESNAKHRQLLETGPRGIAIVATRFAGIGGHGGGAHIAELGNIID